MSVTGCCAACKMPPKTSTVSMSSGNAGNQSAAVSQKSSSMASVSDFIPNGNSSTIQQALPGGLTFNDSAGGVSHLPSKGEVTSQQSQVVQQQSQGAQQTQKGGDQSPVVQQSSQSVQQQQPQPAQQQSQGVQQQAQGAKQQPQGVQQQQSQGVQQQQSQAVQSQQPQGAQPQQPQGAQPQSQGTTQQLQGAQPQSQAAQPQPQGAQQQPIVALPTASTQPTGDTPLLSSDGAAQIGTVKQGVSQPGSGESNVVSQQSGAPSSQAVSADPSQSSAIAADRAASSADTSFVASNSNSNINNVPQNNQFAANAAAAGAQGNIVNNMPMSTVQQGQGKGSGFSDVNAGNSNGNKIMNDLVGDASKLSILQSSAKAGDLDAQKLLNDIGALIKGDDEESLKTRKKKKKQADLMADRLGEVSEGLRIWFRKMEEKKDAQQLQEQTALQRRIRDWLKDHHDKKQDEESPQLA